MSKTEAQTRSELIDQQLAQSGWNVKDRSQVIEEFDILVQLPTGVAEARTPYEGHQFSDYVLLGKDSKPLAVIEAKKTSRDAARRNGLIVYQRFQYRQPMCHPRPRALIGGFALCVVGF